MPETSFALIYPKRTIIHAIFVVCYLQPAGEKKKTRRAERRSTSIRKVSVGPNEQPVVRANRKRKLFRIQRNKSTPPNWIIMRIGVIIISLMIQERAGADGQIITTNRSRTNIFRKIVLLFINDLGDGRRLERFLPLDSQRVSSLIAIYSGDAENWRERMFVLFLFFHFSAANNTLHDAFVVTSN